MALTTAGLNYLASRLCNNATMTKITHLGVGESATAWAAGQTDLLGAGRIRKGMDSGFPTVSGNVATFQATFQAAEANFNWQEWGLFTAATGGTMLNRKVENNSTKLSGQIWVLKVTVTLNVS